MNKRISLVAIVFVIITVILLFFSEKSFAIGFKGGGPQGAQIPSYYNPAVQPPPMPPGFPYKWVGDELIKRFTNDGLEIESHLNLVREYNPATIIFTSGTRYNHFLPRYLLIL